MKIGDMVKVNIEGTEHTLPVYGEVYKPIYWMGFYPGPSYLAAVEVYFEGHIREFALPVPTDWVVQAPSDPVQ